MCLAIARHRNGGFMKARIIRDILAITPAAAFLPLMDYTLAELSALADSLVRKKIKSIMAGTAK